MTIYDEYERAFRHVSAHVLMKDKEEVGTVAIKYPLDEDGSAAAFLHLRGCSMVKGTAEPPNRTSKAVQSAIEQLEPVKILDQDYQDQKDFKSSLNKVIKDLKDSTRDITYSGDWVYNLEKADFDVIETV